MFGHCSPLTGQTTKINVEIGIFVAPVKPLKFFKVSQGEYNVINSDMQFTQFWANNLF